MAKKEERFEVVFTDKGNGLTAPTRKVLLDTATGVQYLFVSEGYAGGLCPILDKDGKPLLWEV